MKIFLTKCILNLRHIDQFPHCCCSLFLSCSWTTSQTGGTAGCPHCAQALNSWTAPSTDCVISQGKRSKNSTFTDKICIKVEKSTCEQNLKSGEGPAQLQNRWSICKCNKNTSYLLLDESENPVIHQVRRSRLASPFSGRNCFQVRRRDTEGGGRCGWGPRAGCINSTPSPLNIHYTTHQQTLHIQYLWIISLLKLCFACLERFI